MKTLTQRLNLVFEDGNDLDSLDEDQRVDLGYRTCPHCGERTVHETNTPGAVTPDTTWLCLSCGELFDECPL